MSVSCPVCHGDVMQTKSGVRCEHCQQDFTLQARCPDCGQPLEVLKACGAIDYFCRNGHGLISKKRVVFTPVAD